MSNVSIEIPQQLPAKEQEWVLWD